MPTCAVAAAIVGLTEQLIPDLDALARILSSNGFDRPHIGATVRALHDYAALLKLPPSQACSTATRHHTFYQFGAGTLVPGVRTLLLDPMIVHPIALLVEAGVLGGIGVTDALSRLTVDARCRITPPFHQAAGPLRERLRGVAGHGTCGVGVGETVRHVPVAFCSYGATCADLREQ